MLYEAATDGRRFPGQSTPEILDKVARVAPPAPRLVDPSLDVELERIILKAMDKDPARRYPTAKDFADALHDWSARASDWFSMLPS